MAETMRNMIDEWREISNAPIVGPCTHYVTKSYGECATEAEAQWKRLRELRDSARWAESDSKSPDVNYDASDSYKWFADSLEAILGTPDAKESE